MMQDRQQIREQTGSDEAERRLRLLREIHDNGLRATHFRAQNKTMSHNDSYWDLVIGKAVTKLAYEMYRERVPSIVEEYLRQHYEQESEHSAMFEITERNPIALRIADFHKKILRKHGLVQYFSCFGLLGERMALADGAFFHAERDPHGTPEGFRDELHHVSWPLVLIVALNPSVEELEDAIECQKKFLKIFET
ncbi:MAG TPA: hypothetical protein VFF30_03820 [Nitrososphaerales archaeon]|nr:hypothetical protein [Nitrososphaerales archaeon]